MLTLFSTTLNMFTLKCTLLQSRQKSFLFAECKCIKALTFLKYTHTFKNYLQHSRHKSADSRSASMHGGQIFKTLSAPSSSFILSPASVSTNNKKLQIQKFSKSREWAIEGAIGKAQNALNAWRPLLLTPAPIFFSFRSPNHLSITSRNTLSSGASCCRPGANDVSFLCIFSPLFHRVNKENKHICEYIFSLMCKKTSQI